MKQRLLSGFLSLLLALSLLPCQAPAWGAEHTLTNLTITGPEDILTGTVYIPPLDEITGAVRTVDIPLAAAAEYDYDAALDRDVTADAVWSVSNADGVTVSSTGLLTVTSAADSATAVVTAEYEGLTQTQSIRLERETLRAVRAAIAAGGAESIFIPGYGDPAVSYTYTAAVLDQYGDPIAGADIVWSLSPADTPGIALAAAGSSAVLTVSAGAPAGRCTLTASADGVTGGALDISLTGRRPHKLFFPSPGITGSYGSGILPQFAVHSPDCGCSDISPITYSSSDPDVVSVHPYTGLLTIRKAGAATITAVIPGGVLHDAASASYTVTIRPLDLGDAVLSDIAPQTYTGSPLTPAFTVTAQGRPLTAGEDYTAVYTANTAAGTASVTVTGRGSCTGTRTKTFLIQKATPAADRPAVTGPVYTTTPVESIPVTGTAWLDRIPVDGVFALDAGQALSPGRCTCRWTFTPADTANYNCISGTVSFDVQTGSLSAIRITGTPLRTAYQYGDRFEPAGVTVSAFYTDRPGEAVDVTEQAVFNGDLPLRTGQTAVPVTYGGKSAELGGITTARRLLEIVPVWSASSFSFDGGVKSVTLTNPLPREAAVTYRGNTASDAGSYTASALITLAAGYSAADYDLRLAGAAAGRVTLNWTIAKAAGPSCRLGISVREGAGVLRTADLSGCIPADCGAIDPAVTVDGSGVIAEGATVDLAGRRLVFSLRDTARGGDTGTMRAAFTTQNYETITVTVTVSVTGRDIPELSAAALTRTYSGQAVSVAEITKSALLHGAAVAGTWAFHPAAPAPADVAQSGVYTLVFTPEDAELCAPAEISVPITLTKARPTGVPGFTPVSGGGRTLADAALTADTLSPSGGQLRWDIPAGSTEAGIAIQRGQAYRWIYLPADSGNYEPLTGSAVLWPAGEDAGGGSGGNSGGHSDSGGGSDGAGGGTIRREDGAVIRTIPIPDAAITGGSAGAVISDAGGRAMVELAAEKGCSALVIALTARRTVSSAAITLPASAVDGLRRRTAVSLTADTPAGTISLSHQALDSLGGAPLTLSLRRRGSVLTVGVESGGRRLDSIPGGITVTVPADPAGSGVTVLLLRDDGSRSVVCQPAAGSDVLTFRLPGSATVAFADSGRAPEGIRPAGTAAVVPVGELFSGTTLSAPGISMTRGILALTLWNRAGEPVSRRPEAPDAPAPPGCDPGTSGSGDR